MVILQFFGEGEVDIAYVDENKFWPIEVKWRSQTRPYELKQILQYPQARILAQQEYYSVIDHVSVEPLPLVLGALKEETL